MITDAAYDIDGNERGIIKILREQRFPGTLRTTVPGPVIYRRIWREVEALKLSAGGDQMSRWFGTEWQ